MKFFVIYLIAYFIFKISRIESVESKETKIKQCGSSAKNDIANYYLTLPYKLDKSYLVNFY